jgi:methylmalonyl-CoA mutase, N-terminal domain
VEIRQGLGAKLQKHRPQVAESPIADVFEHRHPSAAEKNWAEKTLAPTLEKSPERPIGAPTGVNLDEHGHARFTTISGVAHSPPLHAGRSPRDWSDESYLGYPGQPPYTRGIHATGYRGKLYTMRQFSGFASPEETNQRYKYLLEHGGSGLSVAFDLPTLMGYDSDHPPAKAKWASAAWPSIRSKTWKFFSAASIWRRPPSR